MARSIFRQAFHHLPLPVQRRLRQYRLKYLDPEWFQQLQEMREGEIGGYSLKPFDKYKCIFVHIPKCAGISVSKSLFGNFGGGHINIREYQAVFTVREFNNYFKFTFVRNPWDRLVSAFFFLKKGGMNEEDKKWAEENLSIYKDFDDFVKKWVNRHNVHVRSWKHFRPQHEYICAYDGTPMVDFIGYYENLEEDFSYIQKRIGIKAKLLSLNVTRSEKRDYKSYYNDKTIQIVTDVYGKDIKIFGYNFNNSSPQKQLINRFTDSNPSAQHTVGEFYR